MSVKSSLWCILVLVLGMVVSACTGGRTAIAPAMDLEARDRVFGVWDWESEHACRENTHRVAFAEDGEVLVLTFQHPLTTREQSKRAVFRYQIVGGEGNAIIGILENEDRLTDAGDPVVWTLKMFTPNTYRWQRNDWRANRYTRAVVRCAGPAPSFPLEGTVG